MAIRTTISNTHARPGHKLQDNHQARASASTAAATSATSAVAAAPGFTISEMDAGRIKCTGEKGLKGLSPAVGGGRH
ncbi:hypothetical protein AWZ03_010627 [Drosophila navojoa]|uniref:Uncharacterized protein n=1 Tax=Drosophila navojoa TaxID=7232 RepID=A0A484B2J8_DRONA|nr:hypothetical protein AWZ03_010627 [Drosophila navojoa]